MRKMTNLVIAATGLTALGAITGCGTTSATSGPAPAAATTSTASGNNSQSHAQHAGTGQNNASSVASAMLNFNTLYDAANQYVTKNKKNLSNLYPFYLSQARLVELGIVKAAKGYIEAIDQCEGLTDITLSMAGLIETI